MEIKTVKNVIHLVIHPDASIDYSANPEVNNPSKRIQSSKLTIPNVNVKGKREVELNSLHIKTDYSPSCKWIGMGIGWDAWQGKDLSGIVDKAALEFMARSMERQLPIFLSCLY